MYIYIYIYTYVYAAAASARADTGARTKQLKERIVRERTAFGREDDTVGTLIELKFVNSSFSSLSSNWN